jgi:hypothetical protein
VIEGVFGAGVVFEAKAAVTEMYLCANESGSALLELGKSPCAERYLRHVAGIVKPRVVIAVGVKVHNHLDLYFKEVIKSPIVQMQHPRHLCQLTNSGKQQRLQPTINRVREILVQK